ncbi:MAG TPA: VOC family protein [Allosphingosinicella sp.]|nr:VOC family protein [Allosphingosinicella sp.]
MILLDHLTLAVRDWRASRAFYVEHLGFRPEFEVPEGGPYGLGVAALQDDAGLTLFLEQTMPPIASGQGSLTIQVEDVHAFHDRLSGADLDFMAPPGVHFWGYGAVLADPDGHVLHVWDKASMEANG